MSITASITTTQTPTYVGQVWYDLMGQPIEETGHSHPPEAAARIAAIDKALVGRWCFAVMKVKTRENGIDRWATSVVFPDGKTRKLIQGEVARSQITAGRFVTLAKAKEAAAAAKLPTEIRMAPDTRVPWLGKAIELRRESFKTMIDFEKWLALVPEDHFVFLFEPGSAVRAPDEDALFAYLAQVPK